MDDALLRWLDSTIGPYVKLYTGNGLKVFPTHGVRKDLTCTCGKADCKNIGKHPFTQHGVNDASGDIAEVAKMFQYREDLNLAIRTGEISNVFVLDVDARKGGLESLNELMTTYGEFPPTVVVLTGNGSHIYFTYPKEGKISNRTNFMPGLDIRSDGGYVIAVPSMHASGKKYEYSETSAGGTVAAPDYLIEMLNRKKKESQKPLSRDHSTGAKSNWSIDEVQRMLDAIDPDMTYQDWLNVGFALHSEGFSLSLWDSWSRGGRKYENGDCEKRWHGFRTDHGITMGTLVDMAQLAGWKPTPAPQETPEPINMDKLIKKGTTIKKSTAPAADTPPPPTPKTVPQRRSIPLCFDAMKVPGLIGDTVRWITKHAIKKQPELALINTLAFAGAVFGRRYASPLNTRTNLYTVGIADTGAGKDHSRKCIKELAHVCGLDERIGADDIRSDSGLLRGLMNNASQLMMIDEFGHFLQGISDERSPHYVRAQTKILLKLYSSSNSVYNHGDYADAKASPIIIQYPNLCIYGTSTEDKYVKALRKSAIESGEINRFITIKARYTKEYPARETSPYEIDESIKERWEKFSAKFGDSLGTIINSSEAAPEPIKIAWGNCEDLQYRLQCRQVDKVFEDSPYRHLWSRLFENIVKIAMIFAIARDKDNPRFETEDFDLAQMIVESSIEYLTHLATYHMSENPQEEVNQEIVNAIKDAGGKMGRRDIMRRFRKVKKRDLDDIINGLIEQEIVEVEKVSEDGKGRAKTYYKTLSE